VFYLLDEDTLEIKASLRGKPNIEEIEKNGIIVLDSHYEYSPRKLEAVKNYDKIRLTFKPEIKTYTEVNKNHIIINIEIHKENGDIDTERSEDLTIFREDYDNPDDTFFTEVTLENGKARKELVVKDTGKYIIEVRNSNFSDTSETVVVEGII